MLRGGRDGRGRGQGDAGWEVDIRGLGDRVEGGDGESGVFVDGEAGDKDCVVVRDSGEMTLIRRSTCLISRTVGTLHDHESLTERIITGHWSHSQIHLQKQGRHQVGSRDPRIVFRYTV